VQKLNLGVFGADLILRNKKIPKFGRVTRCGTTDRIASERKEAKIYIILTQVVQLV